VSGRQAVLAGRSGRGAALHRLRGHRRREVRFFSTGVYEDETLAEDEAAFEKQGHTVMVVPDELVPAVRELIAEHGK
jgi:hypothetical protein